MNWLPEFSNPILRSNGIRIELPTCVKRKGYCLTLINTYNDS